MKAIENAQGVRDVIGEPSEDEAQAWEVADVFLDPVGAATDLVVSKVVSPALESAVPGSSKTVNAIKDLRENVMVAAKLLKLLMR